MPGQFDLSGKVAFVTGAASGIGAGIAEVLAEAGAQVVIFDQNEAGAKTKAAELTEAGHSAGAIQVNLSEEDSVIEACASGIAKYGVPWLLVNNAGVQDREALLEATVAEWDRTLDINARGPFLMTREIARSMVEAGGGRIVNIASNCVLSPMSVGHAAYASSKGALLSLSMTSAFELVEHGITVNTVLPGGVATPGSMNASGPAPTGPARRPPPLGLSDPRDIGAAVLFFATPAAHRITNQSLAVDAGFSLT